MFDWRSFPCPSNFFSSIHMKVLRSGRRPYILLIMTLLLPGDISRPKLAQTDITRRPETHQISYLQRFVLRNLQYLDLAWKKICHLFEERLLLISQTIFQELSRINKSLKWTDRSSQDSCSENLSEILDKFSPTICGDIRIWPLSNIRVQIWRWGLHWGASLTYFKE